MVKCFCVKIENHLEICRTDLYSKISQYQYIYSIYIDIGDCNSYFWCALPLNVPTTQCSLDPLNYPALQGHLFVDHWIDLSAQHVTSAPIVCKIAGRRAVEEVEEEAAGAV